MTGKGEGNTRSERSLELLLHADAQTWLSKLGKLAMQLILFFFCFFQFQFSIDYENIVINCNILPNIRPKSLCLVGQSRGKMFRSHQDKPGFLQEVALHASASPVTVSALACCF